MIPPSTIPWWDRIKNKLIISLSLVFGLALLVFSSICLFSLKKDTLHQISNENIQISNNIKEKIDLFLSSTMNDLLSLANQLGNQEDWEYQQEELFTRYLNKMPDVQHLTLFDDSGKECYTLSKKALDEYQAWLSKLRPNQESVSFRKELLISSVYPSDRIVSMIDISVPIQSLSAKEDINGVIKAGVSLQGLWESLSLPKSEEETAVYLIDRNGKLISHSDLGLINANIDFSHIKKVKQFVFRNQEHLLKSPLIYFNHKNAQVIGVLIPIEKTDWGIVVEKNLDSALLPYYRLRKLVIIIVCALALLVILLTMFIITRFTRSIEHLTQQAKALGQDESSPKIEIDTKDESAHLAEIINHVQKQLNDKNEHLKRRYKELEAINGEFQKSYDELEQVNEQLEESRHELDKKKEFEKQLIETANVLIMVLNEKGEILLFNRKCEEITGYKKSEVIGKNWHRLMTPQDLREECIERFKKTVKEKIPASFDCTLVTKKGTFGLISWHVTFMADEEQNIHSINIGEDITEKKNLQKELELKNKALEGKNEELQNFVSIVSHDLKSPLYILQDFTSILLNDHKSEFGEDVLYYLERIKKNAENMEKLIIDILEFSKIGTIEDEYQQYPIIQILQRSIEDFRPKIQKQNVEVVLAKEFPTVICDPNRLLQVFTNLISNAIKYLDPTRDGVIEIGWLLKNSEYEFFVKDNGIGIDKEYHEKIFQIFQRLKETKEIEGTGVGLAIVKKIIESHGGKIWVNSEKGKGSSFVFTLPALRSLHKSSKTSPTLSSFFA